MAWEFLMALGDIIERMGALRHDPVVERERALVEAMRRLAEVLEAVSPVGLAPSVEQTPRLMTKAEAAAYLRKSVRDFERNVMPDVTAILVGRGRKLYEREELERWLDERKVGGSTRTRGRASGTSGSGTKGSVVTSALARRIADELRSPARRSTPRLFPVGG
ncbi:MAG: hypothetical protein U0234_17885 [Sandaracinus sp.]